VPPHLESDQKRLVKALFQQSFTLPTVVALLSMAQRRLARAAMDEDGASDMSGGFGIQEEAIQKAIGHLTELQNQAEADYNVYNIAYYAQQPGAARETAAFHDAVLKKSTPHLASQHDAFIQSVKDQIQKLQATLKRYQAGEDAAKYGFGN
jgi:hypothetical protein